LLWECSHVIVVIIQTVLYELIRALFRINFTSEKNHAFRSSSKTASHIVMFQINVMDDKVYVNMMIFFCVCKTLSFQQVFDCFKWKIWSDVKCLQGNTDMHLCIFAFLRCFSGHRYVFLLWNIMVSLYNWILNMKVAFFGFFFLIPYSLVCMLMGFLIKPPFVDIVMLVWKPNVMYMFFYIY
jgi:hypothetical protein